MPFTNIGQAGLQPTLYFPTGVDSDSIKDCYLAYGEQDLIYPVPDPDTVSYSGAVDKRWSFTFQSIGNDVPADTQIDRVAVVFMASMPWGKKIRPYFYTGGIKYYSGEQESQSFIVSDNMRDWIQYGNNTPTGGSVPNEAYPGGPINWLRNPATNAPWTLAAITAGEFGFETDTCTPAGTATDLIVLGGAFVAIYWGYGTTPAGGGGGDPLPPPCGQSTTHVGGFVWYASEIQDITPAYGPLTGGTGIVIRGVNFVTGCTITIGGVAATSVVFVDDEHYRCITPAHAIGYADVVINEPSGNAIVKRNGFQYTLFTRGEDIRRMPSVNIRLGLNTGSNSASFSVDGDSNPPKVGEQIQLIDENVSPRRLLFAGNVQSVTQDYEGQNTQLVWRCQAVDYTWLMNRRRPFGSYSQVSASDIVKDLIRRFAPGFTTNFVQTNLAKISVFFDGSLDLQTCLTIVARMIGGGHWYVDFNQDVHFFHVVPPMVSIPTLPAMHSDMTASPTVQQPTVSGTGGSGVGIIRLGPGSALTAVESSAKFDGTYTEAQGFLTFQTTFVYDDGLESAYGPATNPIGFDGLHKHTISNVPIGASAGGRNVVKRRVYVVRNGPSGGGKREPYAQINDNTTTGFTKNGALFNTTLVVPLAGHKPPSAPYVPPPAYGSIQVPSPALAVATTTLDGQTEYRRDGASAATWTPGVYRFRMSNIYKDLTESKMGPASAAITSNGTRPITLNNVPVGAAIEGVPVIARRVWAALGPTEPVESDYESWWIIPNNTETRALNIHPATGGFQKTEQPKSGDDSGPTAPDRPQLGTPVWPNDDGPFLEGFDLPDDVTDDNPDLLRDPQVSSTVDQSQIRNRVFVRGAGSQTERFVAKGATSIPVADGWYYNPRGGQVYCEGSVIDYTGVSATSGPASLTVPGGVPEDLHQGAPVALYLMVEDKQSQADLGAVEVDKNGNPTDGVHEFSIVDTSLFTLFQMYMRGFAELELYSRPVTTVRYSTRDPKTRPGATVKINLTNPPVVGEFLIQEVTIDQFNDESDVVTPRYNVVTSSAKFDLNDLFFQWSQNTTTVNNPPIAPPPHMPPPGDPTGPIKPRDPRIPPSDDDDDEDPEPTTAPIYVAIHRGLSTAANWQASYNLFATAFTTLIAPLPAANPSGVPGSGSATNRAIQRGFSLPKTITSPGTSTQRGSLVYVGDYTRGEQVRVRRWDGQTDSEFFQVPLNPQAEETEPVGYDSSVGAITDWVLSTDLDTLYFVAYDFDLPPPPFYSRIMSYTFSTGAVAQVGVNACGQLDPPDWTAANVIGDGIQMFFSVHVHRNGDTDELFAGVGVGQTGFNSNASGIYKLASGTWTRVLNLTNGQNGEDPLCFATLNGKIYAGLSTLASAAARIVVSADNGASWSTSFTLPASSGGGSKIDRLIVFEGELYALTYANSGASSFITSIYLFDESANTWTKVKQIDSQTTAGQVRTGVDFINLGNRLCVLSVKDSGGTARMLISDNGRDWQEGVEMLNCTTQCGALDD